MAKYSSALDAWLKGEGVKVQATSDFEKACLDFAVAETDADREYQFALISEMLEGKTDSDLVDDSKTIDSVSASIAEAAFVMDDLVGQLIDERRVALRGQEFVRYCNTSCWLYGRPAMGCWTLEISLVREEES